MLHARSSSRFGTGPSQHLHHPNICTIHEINETDDGQLYLVMAHYEGRRSRNGSLVGRMSWKNFNVIDEERRASWNT